MSADSFFWASAAKTGRSTLKLVLLLLADSSGMDGALDPDIPKLAAIAEMGEFEVRSAIEDLLCRGLLEPCPDSGLGLRLAMPRATVAPKVIYGVSPSRWQALRRQVFLRDGWACTYCGSTELPLHCDHVTPFSKGGETVSENLTTACQSCNVAKRARTPSEWRGA